MEQQQQQQVNLNVIIKKLRKAAGLSQIEMAKIIGRDQATVSRLEKGTQSLSLNSVFTLSNFFGISYEDFLNGHVNYWNVAEKFNNSPKVNPRYLSNKSSLVRELIPLLRLLHKKLGADGLKNFLGEFGLEELIYMSPGESISSFIYFDLLASALDQCYVDQNDISELVKLTQSIEYHGSFFRVYEQHENPINIVRAYCLNSTQYEGAIHNRILEFSSRAVTIGFSKRDVIESLDFSKGNLGNFIIQFKREFFANLPACFGHEALIAKNPLNKSKSFKDEVTLKLIMAS